MRRRSAGCSRSTSCFSSRISTRPNQELIAIGLANTLGALFRSFPVSASFSRSAAFRSAGALTQVSAVVSSVLLAVTMLYLTPLFSTYPLPKAILSAIIIMSVASLFKYREMKTLLRQNRTEFITLMLTFVITLLLGVQQGLAVGVAFGALASDLPSATMAGAVALAIGIGIQNFPEGAAVSVPLRREGFSRLKSFWYGQASGIVEPIAGVLGAVSVILIKPILPYALSFAAGAMIYVVVEELIPESQLEKNTDIATMGAMGGFAVMMTLDVALG